MKSIKDKCSFCMYNVSCNYNFPCCDLLEKEVTNGDKCPIENKESPERPSSSKEKK